MKRWVALLLSLVIMASLATGAAQGQGAGQAAFVAVAGGTGFSMALQKDGSLWAWGG